MTATRRFTRYSIILFICIFVCLASIHYLVIDDNLKRVFVFLLPPIFGIIFFYLIRKTKHDLRVESRLEDERLKEASYPNVIPELNNIHLIMDVPRPVVEINFEHRAEIDFTLRDVRPNDDIEYEIAMHSVANEILKYRKPHFRDMWTEEDIKSLKESTKTLVGYIPIINPPKLRNHLALLQVNFPFTKIDNGNIETKLTSQECPTDRFPYVNYRLKVDETKRPLLENHFPNGVDARRILCYFQEEINKHIGFTGQEWVTPKTVPKNTKIYLKDSITDFIKALGLVTKANSKTGQVGGEATNSFNTLNNQLSALFSIQFRVIEELNYDTTGVDINGKNVNFLRDGFFKDGQPAVDLPYINLIDEYVHWDNTVDGKGYVKLSEEVYRMMIESPLPIDIDQFKKLKKNTLAMDVYISLVENLHQIPKDEILYSSFDELRIAFGNNYAKGGHATFYNKLEPALHKALEVYPEAKDSVVLNDYQLVLLNTNEVFPSEGKAQIYIRKDGDIAFIRVFDTDGESIDHNTKYKPILHQLGEMSDAETGSEFHSAASRKLIDGLIDKFKLPRFVKLSYCPSPLAIRESKEVVNNS